MMFTEGDFAPISEASEVEFSPIIQWVKKGHSGSHQTIDGGVIPCSIKENKNGYNFCFRGKISEVVLKMKYIMIGKLNGTIVFTQGNNSRGYKISTIHTTQNVYTKIKGTHADFHEDIGDYDVVYNKQLKLYCLEKIKEDAWQK